MKTLTLIIPCYNEEDALPPLFVRLTELKSALGDAAALDLLFVDDGSKDRTPQILAEIPAHLQPATVVRHDPNRGLGGAIKTGFENARGDYVAMMDADCTYDPLYLVDMLKLMTPDVDVVTGSEFHPQGCIENVSWLRLFLSRGLSWMYRIVLRSRIYSYSCLMRIYRREILPQIAPQSRGFLSCTEVLLYSIRLNHRIVEFPLTLTERQHGETKMPIVRTIFEHLGLLGSCLMGGYRPQPQKRSA